MLEPNEIMDGLRNKFKAIISINKTYREKNQILQEELEKLNTKITEQELKINEIDGKYESISLAEAFSASEEDVQEAKLKVNKIVREIDKCIALLNN